MAHTRASFPRKHGRRSIWNLILSHTYIHTYVRFIEIQKKKKEIEVCEKSGIKAWKT